MVGMSLLAVRPAPLSTLLPIMVATAQHCIEQNRPMWPVDSLTIERLERQYPAAQGYLGCMDAQVVATMILMGRDAEFWPDDSDGEALYLHKLTVHPAWQGQQLSAQMVQAATGYTRAAGRPWLRLDTAADRPKLRAIYERQGFRLVREGHMFGWPAAWYELSVK
jgi:GNAT superfamily N-acetyltransferase